MPNKKPKKQQSKRKSKSKSKKFILNCKPSLNTIDDWTLADAVGAGVLSGTRRPPEEVDLREEWWAIDNQGETGACVGYATAYGVLRWHYVQQEMMRRSDKPSARFIWMANKETDTITDYPTTFLELQGTMVKSALHIAKQYGCVPDRLLPMSGELSTMRLEEFYTIAARYRIASYHNLGTNLKDWKRWLAFNGPILTRLDVDSTWWNASETSGWLEKYYADTAEGGHAVCIVGYTPEHFIVRNSWSESWGDKGFGYASYDYAEAAFTEAYGAVM